MGVSHDSWRWYGRGVLQGLGETAAGLDVDSEEELVDVRPDDEQGQAATPPPARRVDRSTAENFLPALIEAALAAVIVMDESGIVTAWNRQAERTFGWGASAAVGECLADLIVPTRYRDAHIAGLARFRETGEGPVLGQVLELAALHRDGREFPVELRISPAARVDGMTLFIAFVVDITERKEREAALLAASEEARHSRQAIDEFVSMVVHELRQPVAVMSGYADLLLRDLPLGDEPRYRMALEAILRKSTEANALIGDVLTAAKVEGGAMVARRDLVDLCEVTRAAVARAQPAAQLRDGTVSLTRGDGDAHVMGDEGFAGTILDNLLANAINYSPQAPDVRVEVHTGDDVEVVVSDSGKGVPPEMRERIFDRFIRVHDRTPEPGTGLGLYVARHLAERQGGSLRLVHSEPGLGSTFSLRLPAAQRTGG